MTYTEAQTCIADIYDRFTQHDHLHGQPVRNDKQIWQWVDGMTPEAMFYMIYWAQRHPDYKSTDFEDWIDQLAERSPFYVRTAGERWKKNNNNYYVWRLMMLMREAIRSQLAEQSQPKHTLFQWQN